MRTWPTKQAESRRREPFGVVCRYVVARRRRHVFELESLYTPLLHITLVPNLLNIYRTRDNFQTFQEVMPLPTVTSQLEERRHGVSFYAAAMQVQKRNNTLRVRETWL